MLNLQILWNLPYYNRVVRKMTGGKNLSWCWMSFNIAKKRKYSIIKLLASVRQKKENLIVILFKLLFATYTDKDIHYKELVFLHVLSLLTSLIDLKVGSTNIEVSQRFQLFFPCTCSCDIIFRFRYVIPLQTKCWMGSGFRNHHVFICPSHFCVKSIIF